MGENPLQAPTRINTDSYTHTSLMQTKLFHVQLKAECVHQTTYSNFSIHFSIEMEEQHNRVSVKIFATFYHHIYNKKIFKAPNHVEIV